MNPYVIHCERIDHDRYAVRAIRRDTCRIISSYSCDRLTDARERAYDYSQAYKDGVIPAPIVYGAGCQSEPLKAGPMLYSIHTGRLQIK